MVLRPSCGVVCALTIWLCAAQRVQAGGLELLPGGVRSAGRAGAVAARADDAMAMAYNPAAMPWLAGDQVIVNFDVPIHQMCVDPYGYYGWGIYDDRESEFGNPLAVEFDGAGQPSVGATYATTPLPEVCNSAPVLPLPQFAYVAHASEEVALAIGMVAPILVAGAQWGGKDGTIDIDGRAFPTPTRYQILRQEGEFALAPAFGAAYAAAPWLSFGAMLQIAMLRAKSWVIQNATAGTNPARDWLVEATAEDFFLPTVTMAVHARPLRALDLMASFRWADDFDGSGEVVYETNTFHAGAEAGPTPFRNDAIELTRVQLELPWALTVAARLAGELPPLGDEGYQDQRDPIANERWDVEVDFTYNFNKRGGGTLAEVGDDVSIVSRHVGGGGDSQTVSLEDLASVSVDRHLEDAIAVRLAGSYALLPRRLQVHAGGFYESRGVDPSYANIDAFAFARAGASLGLLARFGFVDLMVAYTHIFSETLEVAPPPHQNVDQANFDDPTTGFDQRVGGQFEADGSRSDGTVLADPDAPEPRDADAVARFQQSSAAVGQNPERVINAGKYTAAFDIISVGATFRF